MKPLLQSREFRIRFAASVFLCSMFVLVVAAVAMRVALLASLAIVVPIDWIAIIMAAA
jgi:hypothetical protein